MPKTVTPETANRDCLAAAKAARKAAESMYSALAAKDCDAILEAAKTLERSGCLIRRNVGRL